MINLKDYSVSLSNLHVTIDALKNFNQLINYYSEDMPGAAYLIAKINYNNNIDFQVDRKIIVTALKAQRQKLVDYLATLNIDASDFTEE